MATTWLFDSTSEILSRIIVWTLFWWYRTSPPFIQKLHADQIFLYNYPRIPSYISPCELWAVCIIFPLICFKLMTFFKLSTMEDLKNILLGLTLAYGLNGFLTEIIKVLVGRPRPDYLSRCLPPSSEDLSVCQKGSEDLVAEGRKSFPSGHTSLAFTCMVFMAMYLSRCLILWKTTTGRGLKLLICLFPLLIATLIAISRICDHHHHYQDILAGGLLGGSVGYTTYTLYFPSEVISEQVKDNCPSEHVSAK